MLDPPSDRLLKLLHGLRLCTPRDLRRCHSAVRRLTHDLPAFDSIWLDALVQIGRLTPFQRKLLESSQPERIGIGPCVLVDRLGGGPLGETFRARLQGGIESCALKVLDLGMPLPAESLQRLQELVDCVRGLGSPYVSAPHALQSVGPRQVLVSRYVEGPGLGDLLVRRGRFPSRTVTALGRQLLEGLLALEERGVAHGDVRIANVRITASGTAVLVDTGIRATLEPHLTIHAGLPPERYDGIAPEWIGAHRPPDKHTDLYALGCLLWHLLAGRPPFPGNDPLTKLAAHQTRDIEDVREWSPETPEPLARAIKGLTRRAVSERPKSLGDALDAWPGPRRGARRVLRGFRRRFSVAARRTSRAESAMNWMLVAALLFTVSGLAWRLSDAGARSHLLAWGRHVWKDFEAWRGRQFTPAPPANERGERHLPAQSQSQDLAALPAPDERGVIDLAPGTYQPADIATVGPCVLRAASDARAEIVIRDTPLRIWAETVRMENVSVRASPEWAGNSERGRLVLIQSQLLELDGCYFWDGRPLPGDVTKTNPRSSWLAVGWKLLDEREGNGGNFAARNTVFCVGGAALHLASSPRKVEFDNCLALRSGPLVYWAAARSKSTPLELMLAATTVRQGEALFRWKTGPVRPAQAQVQIEANDCIFDLRGGQALFEFVVPKWDKAWLERVELTGEGSLASPELQSAAWIDAETGLRHEVNEEVAIEGITTAPFEFAGPLNEDPAGSQVARTTAPRRSEAPPGIRAADLPPVAGAGDTVSHAGEDSSSSGGRP